MVTDKIRIMNLQRENLEKKVNAVSILLQENSKWTSEEEAISSIRHIVEESMLELVKEVHQPSHIPKTIRQAHFNTARVMHLFYQRTDGFTDFTTMARKVKKIMFQPVL